MQTLQHTDTKVFSRSVHSTAVVVKPSDAMYCGCTFIWTDIEEMDRNIHINTTEFDFI